jgi:hypothetical protein
MQDWRAAEAKTDTRGSMRQHPNIYIYIYIKKSHKSIKKKKKHQKKKPQKSLNKASTNSLKKPQNNNKNQNQSPPPLALKQHRDDERAPVLRKVDERDFQREREPAQLVLARGVDVRVRQRVGLAAGSGTGWQWHGVAGGPVDAAGQCGHFGTG